MSFIQTLKYIIHPFDRSHISDELWLELLESGATHHEIQWHFGLSESIERRIQHLTKRERRQYAVYETHLSSRMALWWVLKQRQIQSSFRTSLGQALAYPLLLFCLAFIMMLLLNHVMLPRMSGLFVIASASHPTASEYQGLMVLEILYLILIIVFFIGLLIPGRYRELALIRYYHHPCLKGYRVILTSRFVLWMIKGIQQGLSIQTLLEILAHGIDPVMGHWSHTIQEDLKNGQSLALAVERMDKHLKQLFVIQDDDHSIENHLQRYHTLISHRVKTIIKQYRVIGLSWGYLSFGFIVLSAYQIMFEPIRQLENLL